MIALGRRYMLFSLLPLVFNETRGRTYFRLPLEYMPWKSALGLQKCLSERCFHTKEGRVRLHCKHLENLERNIVGRVWGWRKREDDSKTGGQSEGSLRNTCLNCVNMSVLVAMLDSAWA